MELYQGILAGRVKWSELKADSRNHPHTTENTYVFSKTILEHIVKQRYSDSLPITFFRPSIISCSSDGLVGSRFTPPCSVGLAMQSPGARFWHYSPTLVDIVHVDAVSHLLLQTVDKPFESKKGNAIVVMATGNSSLVKEYYCDRLVYKGKFIFFLSNRAVVHALRLLELALYHALLGSKMARMFRKLYRSFDYFFTHEWDFEPNCVTASSELVDSLSVWVRDNYPAPKMTRCRGAMDLLSCYIAAQRFGHHQNFLVVALTAVCFPGAKLDWQTPYEILKLYVSFNLCLYGALYALNGITDAKDDAKHQQKKHRPFAKALWAPGEPGALSHVHGWCYMAVLLVCAFVSGYTMRGVRMVHTYCAFIVLNLLYSFGMRSVKYCRFHFVALTAPCRMYLGTILTGSQPHIAVYIMQYFHMVAVQSTKVRIEQGRIRHGDINGWGRGTVELTSGLCLLVSCVWYSTSDDPAKWLIITIGIVANMWYCVVPYFSRRAEMLHRRLYTIDCHARNRKECSDMTTV